MLWYASRHDYIMYSNDKSLDTLMHMVTFYTLVMMVRNLMMISMMRRSDPEAAWHGRRKQHLARLLWLQGQQEVLSHLGNQVRPHRAFWRGNRGQNLVHVHGL